MAQYKGAASEGSRAATLMKKRERAKEELERMKMKIAEVEIKLETTPILLQITMMLFTLFIHSILPDFFIINNEGGRVLLVLNF